MPGVVTIERVRARPAGAVLFVDLGVGVSRTLPLDRVSTIKERLTRAIRAEIPQAEITITTEPRALDDETVRERVMMIARNAASPFITSPCKTISGRLSVSADLEVDGTLPLAAAHDIASRLEEALREELGPEVEVETHIEPLPADVLPGRDACAARIAEVSALLAALAAGIPGLGEVHDVRVRETADGEIVNFHCRVDPALSVRAVHDLVDGIERGLRQRFPTILRVIGHAEPQAHKLRALQLHGMSTAAPSKRPCRADRRALEFASVERIARHLHLDAGARRYGQKFMRVAARRDSATETSWRSSQSSR